MAGIVRTWAPNIPQGGVVVSQLLQGMAASSGSPRVAIHGAAIFLPRVRLSGGGGMWSDRDAVSMIVVGEPGHGHGLESTGSSLRMGGD